MMSLARGVCLTTVLLVAAASAQAEPLNLGALKGLPDLNTSVNVTTGYDATTNIFTVEAVLNQYTEGDGTSHPAGNLDGETVSMTLEAEIDEAGDLVAGTLVIEGRVFTDTPPNIFDDLEGTLLTANLTDFGFTGTGASTVFEFLGTPAEVDGATGLLNDEFGSTIGSILNPGSDATFVDFSGDFAGSDGDASATMNTFFVPEPAGATLLGLVAVAMAPRRGVEAKRGRAGRQERHGR